MKTKIKILLFLSLFSFLTILNFKYIDTVFANNNIETLTLEQALTELANENLHYFDSASLLYLNEDNYNNTLTNDADKILSYLKEIVGTMLAPSTLNDFEYAQGTDTVSYENIEAYITDYQLQNKLTVSGKLETQTSFLMGFHLGQAAIALSDDFKITNGSDSTTITFYPVDYIANEKNENNYNLGKALEALDYSKYKYALIKTGALKANEATEGGYEFDEDYFELNKYYELYPLQFLNGITSDSSSVCPVIPDLDPIEYAIGKCPLYVEEEPSLSLKYLIDSIKPHNQKAGIQTMFQIGFDLGRIDGMEFEEPPFASDDLGACFHLDFKLKDEKVNNSEILYLMPEHDEYYSVDSSNVLTANRILNCLDGLGNDSNNNNYDFISYLDEDLKPDIGETKFVTNTEGEDDEKIEYGVKQLIAHYQNYESNKEIFRELPKYTRGTLEVKTAFAMGTQMGQLYRNIATNNNSDICTDNVINFSPANSISKENEGVFNTNNGPYDYLEEDMSNFRILQEALSCLYTDLEIKIDKPIENISKSELFKEDIFSKIGNKNKLGIAVMYKLGKEFGLRGGILKYPGTGFDPLSKLDVGTLADQVKRTEDFTNYTPRNPGIMDWRGITEVDGDESMTGTQLTASLIGKIIRFFEYFVGVIAVLMFIYGGIKYVFANGDETKAGEGLKSILSGMIGIIIIVMARFIVEMLVPIRESNQTGLDRTKVFTTDILATQQANQIINWILGFTSITLISVLIYGGYLWITSRGDEGIQEKAKKIITSSIIGFIVIFSAYTIMMIILKGAGIENKNSNVTMVDKQTIIEQLIYNDIDYETIKDLEVTSSGFEITFDDEEALNVALEELVGSYTIFEQNGTRLSVGY